MTTEPNYTDAQMHMTKGECKVINETKESCAELLSRMGDDASKWAGEFRKIAITLGYSDMDEGWLIGWFANAIEHSGDVRRWKAERQAAMQGQGGEVVIPSASSNCPICGVDSPHGHNMKDRWIGVDLDNTLATDGGGRLDPYTIGEPIYPMVHRVMNWVARGYEVRIFTARMCEYSYTSKQHRNVGRMQEAIGDWCLTHIGTRLEATNQKDGAMEVLWDDRAVRVLPDQGVPSFLFERSIQPPQPVRSVSEEDARDAGRYRWLRHYGVFGGADLWDWEGHTMTIGPALDAVIDAAIAQEKQS